MDYLRIARPIPRRLIDLVKLKCGGGVSQSADRCARMGNVERLEDIRYAAFPRLAAG